jgi:hypothetical protein
MDSSELRFAVSYLLRVASGVEVWRHISHLLDVHSLRIPFDSINTLYLHYTPHITGYEPSYLHSVKLDEVWSCNTGVI